ncbi:Uncharacterised protein [uncultured Anaerotruncus sp.]|uniref:DUF6273 domain-containing protein n=1 Tax=uncultured Anaerotruncus sp. TaxID=905011 RepID=A0A6N2R6K7_9FIRM
MATTLGSKAVGSIVKLKENGAPVEFYVAKHDYESGLNGTGHTLVVRKDAHSLISFRARYFRGSDAETWLNGAYLNSLSAEIKGKLSPTVIPLYDNSESTTMVTKVFILSVSEFGYSKGDGEGTELPNGKELRTVYNSGMKVNQGTRTPSTITLLYINTKGELKQSENEVYMRPAFTLPASLYVDDSGLVVVNTPPAISSSIPSGSGLGTKEEGFNFPYTVTDVDGDAVTVKEYLDNVVKRSYQASLGQENTFEAVTAAHWQTVLNGSHTLKVAANDGKADSAPYTATFSKAVYSASITMTEPLPADALISVAVLSLTGSIPEDAALQVQLTNNGKDPQPVWEDATSSVKNGSNHVFANQAAANGFAFNFKVTVSRGPSGQGGHISKIGGAFQ